MSPAECELIFHTISSEGGRLILSLLESNIKEHEDELMESASRTESFTPEIFLKHAVSRKALLKFRETLTDAASRAPSRPQPARAG